MVHQKHCAESLDLRLRQRVLLMGTSKFLHAKGKSFLELNIVVSF